MNEAYTLHLIHVLPDARTLAAYVIHFLGTDKQTGGEKSRYAKMLYDIAEAFNKKHIDNLEFDLEKMQISVTTVHGTVYTLMLPEPISADEVEDILVRTLKQLGEIEVKHAVYHNQPDETTLALIFDKGHGPIRNSKGTLLELIPFVTHCPN